MITLSILPTARLSALLTGRPTTGEPRAVSARAAAPDGGDVVVAPNCGGPDCATLHRREVVFTASPMAVYCSARELPMAPVTTVPVLMVFSADKFTVPPARASNWV